MYGDGVFRTLQIKQGAPHCWQQHYQKLKHDCMILGLNCPKSEEILADFSGQSDCVAKVIITRGSAARGYASPATAHETRVTSFSPMPIYPLTHAIQGVAVHLCKLRLGHQPILAGIKHLNRLENVLAANECQQAGMSEGVLLDEQDWVISGTRSNLFCIRNGTLYTPDLGQCGIAGVQRDRVLDWAEKQNFPYKILPISLDDLLLSDEIFLVNSVFGLWPISQLNDYQQTSHPVSWIIQQWLTDETH